MVSGGGGDGEVRGRNGDGDGAKSRRWGRIGDLKRIEPASQLGSDLG